MSKLFLNQDIIFKKRGGYYYVYNNRTGSLFYGKKELWKFLKHFKTGKELETLKQNPSFPKWVKLLPNLIETKYLLYDSKDETEQYLDFFPTRTYYTVYYKHKEGTDVAIYRIEPNGDPDFEIKTLKGTTGELWNLCNGNNTVHQLILYFAEKTGNSYEDTKHDVFEKMNQWISLDTQTLKLLPQSLLSYEKVPQHLISPAPISPSLKVSKPKQERDTRRYHISGIKEGYHQFERVESTLAHIYRIPHPILGGKTYGKAFLSQLLKLKPLEMGSKILEIGGGHGDISKEILVQLKETKPEIFPSLTYILYDLSPQLIKSQRRIHKKVGVHVEHIQGDAEILALEDNSIDIIFSNEVIADFLTPKVTLKDVKKLAKKHEIPINQEFLDTLKDAPKRFLLNLGAFLLLKEIQRVLKPGGIAVITEYGEIGRASCRERV